MNDAEDSLSTILPVDVIVEQEAQEIHKVKEGDFEKFLSLVIASGRPSTALLQNTWLLSNPKKRAVPLALAEGERLPKGAGAVRVHGGGYAGTVQPFVPNEQVAGFKSAMESLLGPEKCHILHIRPQSGCVAADNLVTGFKAAVHPKAKFYQIDLRNRAELDNLYEREKINGVFTSRLFLRQVSLCPRP